MRIMAAAIVILVAGVLAMGWQLRSVINTDYQLSQELYDLRSQQADKAQVDELRFQRECDSQSLAAFSHAGYKIGKNEKSGTVFNADYESHYNRKLGQCFILSHEYQLTKYTTDFLHDAYSRREYAELFVMSLESSAPQIATCVLRPPQGGERTCESKAEFESFVSQYMEGTPGEHYAIPNTR